MTSLSLQDDYEALVECIEDALDLPSDPGNHRRLVRFSCRCVLQMLYP